MKNSSVNSVTLNLESSDTNSKVDVNNQFITVILYSASKLGLPSESTVSCWFCHKSFEAFDLYRSHLCCVSVSEVPKFYECTLCKIKFSSVQLLQKHLCGHRTYKCGICHSGFMTKATLTKHVKTFRHNAKLFGKFISDGLEGKKLQNQSPLKLDKVERDGKDCAKPSKSKLKSDRAVNHCDHCGQIFEYRHQFEQHMMGHKQNTCSPCKASFSTKKLLSRHQRTVHGQKTETKVHKCLTCDKVFQRPIHLKVHQRVHTGEKPIHCHTCQKSFPNKNALLRHKKTTCHYKREQGNTVKVEKLFLCEECGARFCLQQTLTRHMELIHKCSKSFLCPFCAYSTKYETNLKRHIESHANIKRFTCEICGASFHAQASLKDHHSYIHSEKRNFVCDLCPKTFKGKSGLQRHLRAHSEDRPFKCHCNQTYKRMSHLKRHMATAHQITVTSKKIEKFEIHNGNLDVKVPTLPIITDSLCTITMPLCPSITTSHGNMLNDLTEKDVLLSLQESNKSKIDLPEIPIQKECTFYTPEAVEQSLQEPYINPCIIVDSIQKDDTLDTVTQEESPVLSNLFLGSPIRSEKKDIMLTTPESVWNGNHGFSPLKIPSSLQSSDYESPSELIDSLLMNPDFASMCKALPMDNKSLLEKQLFDEPTLHFGLLTSSHDFSNSKSHPGNDWLGNEVSKKFLSPSNISIESNSYSLDDCSESLLFPNDVHMSLDDPISDIPIDFYNSPMYAD